MKVFIFVCGEGLGHTARSMAAGDEFQRAGHDVIIGAYGYSAELIGQNGFKVICIPPEIRLVGENGTLNMNSSIRESIKLGQISGFSNLMGMVKKEAPDVVLSDSYYLGTLAALRYHIPVCLMVNQSSMEDFFKGGFILRVLGRFAKVFYNAVFLKVDHIIIPDFPKPHTICQLNLNFKSNVGNKTLYTGPLPAKRAGEVKGENLSRPHVLSLIGGFGYRKPIFLKIIEAAKKDSGINYTMLTGPGIKPADFEHLPGNVNMLPFVPDQYTFLKSSDVVIAPGGHTTMMEALAFGIPIISFPDKGHIEQQNNARGLEREGCGFRMDYNSGAEEILDCIRKAISGKLTSPQKLAIIASEMKGTEALRKIMEKLVSDQRI